MLKNQLLIFHPSYNFFAIYHEKTTEIVKKLNKLNLRKINIAFLGKVISINKNNIECRNLIDLAILLYLFYFNLILNMLMISGEIGK
jgi:hypothetical protein